jgi:prepilin-type N-terminal cleavage/methylation domain-containing protein
LLAQRGFSLIEVMAAALITVIAVLGLAYTFGVGRGLIDRYAVARGALAAAEERLERLTILSIRQPWHAELAVGPPDHGPFPRQLNGSPRGSESWAVSWVDDRVDGTWPADSDTHDYKRATVVIQWVHDGVQDHITLSRILP